MFEIYPSIKITENTRPVYLEGTSWYAYDLHYDVI